MSVAVKLDSLEQKIRSHLEVRENEAAAREACDLLGPEILGWLCGVFNDDDVARETYDSFRKELPTELWAFRWQFSFRPWLYGVARRVAFRRLRSPSRQDLPLGGSIAPPKAANTDTDVRTWVKTELSPSAFARLRDHLEPEERMVLILRVDRGMSWEDVARAMEHPGSPDMLRESANRLRRYFHRTRDRLRELAIQEGLLVNGG